MQLALCSGTKGGHSTTGLHTMGWPSADREHSWVSALWTVRGAEHPEGLAKGGAHASYQQAMAEAQRLLGTGQPAPPPPLATASPGRSIPTGPPAGHTGGHAKAADRERRVDSDLRAAVMRGGDDSQVAINLAIVDALGRLGTGGSAARSSHDTDPFEQFFDQGVHTDHDSSKGSSAAGARNMARLAAAIQRDPDRWTVQCNLAAAKALGADLQGVHWTMEEYGARQLRFKGNESIERMWALLAHLHGLLMRGESSLALARVCQFLKATELAVQCSGHWRLAWSLTALPEIRSMAANSAGHGLGHPMEYHASVQWLRDCAAIETAIAKGGPRAAAVQPSAAKEPWRQAARKERTEERAVARGRQLDLDQACVALEQLCGKRTVPRNRSRLRQLQIAPTRSIC
eukprot:2971188-Amphidinium_carterae.1